MEFNGYRRSNGAVGTRNYVGVLSTVVCANEVVDAISRQVQGAAPFMHQQGCCQTPVDITRVNETLIGLGSNPNLASVLLVSFRMREHECHCGGKRHFKDRQASRDSGDPGYWRGGKIHCRGSAPGPGHGARGFRNGTGTLPGQ